MVALAISLMFDGCARFRADQMGLPPLIQPTISTARILEAFAKDLAEATGGKLSIKVYSNASLLPVSVIKRAVQMGRMQTARP